MEPPFSPSPGADISTRPNPDADVARRRVTIILLCVLSLLAFLGGARVVARSHGNPEAFLVGLFLCLLGAPIPFLAGRSV